VSNLIRPNITPPKPKPSQPQLDTWISPQDTFLFGKHEGESIDKVAGDDPGYLRWIVNNVESIMEEDREAISQTLTCADRGRNRTRR
jgi:hypothetical protein